MRRLLLTTLLLAALATDASAGNTGCIYRPKVVQNVSLSFADSCLLYIACKIRNALRDEE